MTSALRLPPLPTLRDLVKLYKVTATKKLAQNFILNEKLTDKMVRKAGNLAGSNVLEVGPGPGGLTRSILRHGPQKLIVIEKDKRFRPILEMLSDAYEEVNGDMEIIFDDVLKTDLSNLFPNCEAKAWEDKSPNVNIIGNLPFNVATPLIIRWFHRISKRDGPWQYGRARMTLTFQKEVAERIVAEPLNEQRCRLSIMAQTWTRPVLHFILPRTVFLPKPDVDAALVSFIPLSVPRTQHDFKIFEKVTRHIFSFRQKYSIRGSETLFPLDCRKELGEVMYKLADIDPKTRPMKLTVEEVDRLVSAYTYLLEKHPEIGLYEYRASNRILGQRATKDLEIEECTL